MSNIRRIAKAIGTSELTLRRGMEQKVVPFGAAVKCNKRYAYIFWPSKVKEYVGIDLNEEPGGDAECLN